MRILVTGNLGYVGPRLVARLLEDGHECLGLDAGWFRHATAEPITIPPVQHIVDIRDLVGRDEGRRRLRQILDGVDAVVHLAAISNDPVADQMPSVTEAVNFEASAQFIGLVRDAGIERFVFYSSCTVYGDADGAVDETTPPRILTPYADTKVRLERRLRELAGSSFWPVIFRAATVYGYSPALRLDLIVNGMTGWAIATGTVRLMSTGDALRPQLHLDDLVEFTSDVLARGDGSFASLAGDPINVGSNDSNHSIRELADLVAAQIPGARVVRDSGAWVDRRSYRVRFDRLGELVPETPLRRSVEGSIAALADEYRRIGLTEPDVRSLRFTRLQQLRRAQGQGILDEQLRFVSSAGALQHAARR